MKYFPISSDLFARNRNKVLRQLPHDSIAVIHSNDLMPRNGDLFFKFRQHSDLFYLTGIEQEKTILVLIPGASDNKEKAVLFILEPKPEIEIWEGKKLTITQAQQISGISHIEYEHTFHIFFAKLLQHYNCIYLNKNENPRLHTFVKSRDDRFKRIIRKRFPEKQIERLAPIITECRLRKEPEEIALIEQACNITTNAFKQTVPYIKPGIYEYEIEALLTKEFIAHGASGHAFEPIIASGANSCFLHYVSNNTVLQPNTIVLMDFGAEYANYASDATRVIPVSGKFTQRQKQVYEAVLRVLKQTTKLIITGTTILEYQEQTKLYIQEELLHLGLIKQHDITKQTKDKPAYFTYFMHGVSHFIGLDMHDVGNKDTVLEPGMVVSCEPGIYIANEGIGIRLENDILITETGNKNLLEQMPIEIEEIEDLMNSYWHNKKIN